MSDTGEHLGPELLAPELLARMASFQSCRASGINFLIIRFSWAIKIAGGCYFCKDIFKLFDLHDTGGWNVFSIFTMIIWEVLEGCTLIRQRRIRKNQVSNLDPMPRYL